MSEINQPNVRGEEVMRLLVTHEALSIGTMQTLMEPAITIKRLRDVLGRLVKRRIISRRVFDLYGGSASFYEIAEPFRSDLGVSTVHSSLLIHNDLCALSVEWLRRRFPTAQFVREHAIPRSEQLRNVMRYKPGARDTLPDILMVFPPRDERKVVCVAIEVERSAKSTKRLLRKFTKYASRTLLDGVLYLSEDEQLLAALSDRFRERVAQETRRIMNYRDHFFVTARFPSRQVLELGQAENSVGRAVSLENWIRLLASIPMLERRDRAFFESGGVCPS